MLGFFPDPYPDELLYSVCARYANRVNYPNKLEVSRDILGKRGLSAIVDFPNRLERLLASIPYSNYSIEDLINKNTLFPFFEPFLIPEKAKDIRNDLKGTENNRIRTRLAINTNQVKKPEFLRYCPDCIKDDRNQFGETFWHRVHQLAGILVCPVHKCFLQNSSIEWNRKSSALFHLAEDEDRTKTTKYINLKKADHKVLLWLAEVSLWILNQNNLSLKEGELQSRYYNLLLQRKFAYYNGRTRGKKLLESFVDFYGRNVLKLLGCEITFSRDCWLIKLMEKARTKTFFHPILHLLLLNFLDVDIKTFFTSFIEFKPFGTPPYPCLNSASEHYKKLMIKSCHVADNLGKGKLADQPIAIFSCDCGFIYQRLGPDKSSEDKYRYNSVREYGYVWERELGKQWKNLNLSLSQIARNFRTTTLLIARHAIRLNLPMNTKGTRSLQGYKRYRNPRSYFNENKKKYRKQWLEFIKTHPNHNRAKLLKETNFLYLWLKKNDTKWFESNLPKYKRGIRKKSLIDWDKIDKKLIKLVKEECRKIHNMQPPTRISITEIIRRVGYKKWIEKRKTKLPLTDRFLSENLESLEDFMIRKVDWVKNYYIRIGKMPTKGQFRIKGALINNTCNNSKKVQDEIGKALNEISKTIFNN